MSSAYGHRIFPMGTTPAEPDAYMGYHTLRIPRRHDFNSRFMWTPGCRWGGKHCPHQPKFVSQYWYVTGRQGRTTDRIQYQCQEHAKRFCKINGLTLPSTDEAAA